MKLRPASTRLAPARAGATLIAVSSLALLSFSQGAPPCSRSAVVRSAGLATPGTYGLPELAMRGAPILGYPLSLAVRGRPAAAGWLVLAIESQPGFLPAFGATLYPWPPLGLVPFVLDAGGSSPALAVPPTIAGGCGSSFVAQAVVVDPRALGGLAFTRAARFGFGVRGHDVLVGPPTTLVGAHNGLFGSVADVDGDQLPDIVIAGTEFPGSGLPQGRGAVTVFKGHGDGTFAPAQWHVATEQRALYVAAADLDGDERVDLVATSSAGASQGGVAVLLGQGGGAFGPPTIQNAGAGPTAFLLADLDGDEALDLLAVNVLSSGGFRFGALAVLAGNGDGTFATPVRYNAGSSPRSLAVGDFDGDGLPDVVVGRSGMGISPQAAIVFFPGRGDGALGAATAFSAFPGSASLGQVASADLDGDGALDVVALIYNGPGSGGYVSILLGNGDGTFQGARTFAVMGRPSSVSVADLDGDQRPDLHLALDLALGADRLTLFLGLGDGTFREGSSTLHSSTTQSFALADVDGDLVPDLVGSAPSTGVVEVRRNLLLGPAAPAGGPTAR